MPLPQSRIINSLIESYLRIRQDDWKVATDADTIDPQKFDENTANKLSVCQSLVLPPDMEMPTTRWIDYLKKVALALRDESYEVQKKYSGFGFILKHTVYDKPLLLETLAAIRSYLIKELNSTPIANRSLAARKKTLLDNRKSIVKEMEKLRKNGEDTDAKREAVNAIDATLENLGLENDDIPESERSAKEYFYSLNYHIAFYNAVIKKRDPFVAKLHEENFDNFAANAVSKSRPLLLTTKLYQHKLDTQPYAAAESSSESGLSYANITSELKYQLENPTPAEAVTESKSCFAASTNAKSDGSANTSGFYNTRNRRQQGRKDKDHKLEPIVVPSMHS